MKNEILSLIADFLEVKPEELQDYKTLEDLDIDSLDFVEIMFEIEEKYDAPVLSHMQRCRDQLHTLGDVLSMTEELILQHRGAGPAPSHG
ncbi:acyl carrier protein [Pararhodospirillum photometricum]|uniref:Carrier domain-containing protein n=1 Tax=Pararhodospirillum photometricum DSM 122 TaxID=1150469 RepID=H6SS56_PARPM|nr:acyl carrier protein [Pararhodospirillum photometricum]CCG07735.1 Putative uncharacterized protein [Pararhodospirillum photometricum DSM 122]